MEFWKFTTKKLHRWCFSINFARFLRTAIPWNTSRWLLLGLYRSNVMLCAICTICTLKNVKNTHAGVILLAACNFTKSITPLCVFHLFQIVQMVQNHAKCLKWNLYPSLKQIPYIVLLLLVVTLKMLNLFLSTVLIPLLNWPIRWDFGSDWRRKLKNNKKQQII